MTTNKTANSAFGTASLDNTFEGFKYFKMQPPDESKGETTTELVARLFGPMHSYVDSGIWKVFYGQHYGHHRNNPRNPERPRAAPFGCIQKKNRDKQVTDPCPKCDQMEAAREAIRKREQKIAAANPNANEAQLKELAKKDPVISERNKWLRANNCDKKFWINVMTLDGQFGVLQLSYKTTEKILVPLLRELRDRGVDAFDLNSGVYLRFIRSGRNFEAQDKIEVAQEQIEVNGRKAFIDKEAPLTPDQIEKAARILPDLKKDVVKFISFEKMQELVNSSGDPDETDRIWPLEKRGEATQAKGGVSLDVEDDGPPADEDESVSTTPVQAKSVQTIAEPEADPTEAELEARLAAIRAAKAKSATTATPASAVVTKMSGSPATDKDVEEFLNDFDA